MKSDHRLHESPSAGILLMVLAVFLTFCAGPTHAASEPGAVTIVLNNEPEDLDPGNAIRNIAGQVLMDNIMESLAEFNYADGSITPRLATSWKQIDPNTWHFFLRKGVKFHDGRDFNAAAVVFSIKRIYEKKIGSGIRNKFFSHLKMEGKALDSHTLEIKTDTPEPLLLTLLGFMTVCSPNTPLDKSIRNPIGTGPYKLVKWDAGTQVVLERFDGYWGNKPQVQKAVYVWRKESAVRVSMVEIGEADLAPEVAKQYATRPDMIFSYLNSETLFFRIGSMWEREAPLNDRRVRMALNYAVDRNAIRGSIVSKDVIPAMQIIGPSVFGHNPDLKPWPYDPQKAKQLLDEARKDGVPVDKEILIVARTEQFAGIDELTEALMTMYKAVGLNVKLRMLESGVWRGYQNKPTSANTGPCLVGSQHDNMTDAVFSVFMKYHCSGIQSPMCDKATDALMEKAQVATGEERRSLWRQVLKRIHEEIIVDVMLFHMVGYCCVGKRINFKPTTATSIYIPLAQITFK